MIEEMQLKAGADRKSPEPAQQPTGRISPSKAALRTIVQVPKTEISKNRTQHSFDRSVQYTQKQARLTPGLNKVLINEKLTSLSKA